MPAIEQLAAQSLALRALDTEKQSQSNTLIAAARSLDPQIDTESIRAAWTEKWLKQNQNRKGNS